MDNLEELYNRLKNLNSLLDRKIQILNEVLSITESQKVFFETRDKLELEELNSLSLEEKQSLINEMVDIDNMFISIFESFSGELNNNKNIFKDEIREMQDKIEKITNIDLQIRLGEQKNRQFLSNNANIVNGVQRIKSLKPSREYMLKKYKENTRGYNK